MGRKKGLVLVLFDNEFGFISPTCLPSSLKSHF